MYWYVPHVPQAIEHIHLEDIPWAARVEPHNPANTKKVFKFASAYNTPRQCLGPNPWTSGLLELEFEQWYVSALACIRFVDTWAGVDVTGLGVSGVSAQQ